jgi:hypothetical protein
VTTENLEEIKARKKQLREDEIDRIQIEGKFGQGKRRFGLGLIMSKLSKTSEVSIMIGFLLMNLEKILISILCVFSPLYVWLRKASMRMFSKEWLMIKVVGRSILTKSKNRDIWDFGGV